MNMQTAATAPSFKNSPIACVDADRLSDGSLAFNVLISGGIVIGAIDQSHAESIADAINIGSAWIQLARKDGSADLLAALKVVASCCADQHGGTTLGDYEMRIVQAAIANAEGRA